MHGVSQSRRIRRRQSLHYPAVTAINKTLASGHPIRHFQALLLIPETNFHSSLSQRLVGPVAVRSSASMFQNFLTVTSTRDLSDLINVVLPPKTGSRPILKHIY
ncbi:hypothetical protein CEXT_581861 [Caerostris extrusa]|uniref:Uncharacterized protein n=1 Tax=Caerostris extrusa TaxID=172846 RepID=A0AAV4R6C9_CAEEX|nr:hypothetical protein CEXT_581861 [Caerostris extrusa]